MPLEFETKDLYGGAIVVDLPNDVFDASDLRQIPDHQEVFLSDKTLTSIIIEINEYQHSGTVTNLTSTDTISNHPDIAAASYHFTDTIEAPDHFSSSGIQTSPTQLAQPSLRNYPSYISTATIMCPEVDLSKRSILPVAWQTNPAQKDQLVGVLQLLVRMEDYQTDLCVRINVPLKELGDGGSEAAKEELGSAEEIMRRITQSLAVKDFGLFGGE